MSGPRQRFRLRQDGIPVAWAEGVGALAEIQHCALVYSQDGPVEIEQHRSGKWRRLPIARLTPSIPGAN